ncbi:succinate--CoA ligase subunit beta, partial [Stenotrophomonas maltophilia]
PAGKFASTTDEAVAASNSLVPGPWMDNTHIHAGFIGKAGVVKFFQTTVDVQAAASMMIGTSKATSPTAGVELTVNLVLVTT